MSPGPATPSKSARVACHQARDLFYVCVREQGLDFKPGCDIPRACKQLRASFEKSCPASWVQHFDAQQESQARRAKYLHKLIGDQGTSAAGSLTGKAQS